MSGALPPKGFSSARSEMHTVSIGRRFRRIYMDRYPDPLGFGTRPSRFSDPRRRIAASRFGVLYHGDTLKVCFLEAVLRDQRDDVIGDLPIAKDEIDRRR